VFDAAKCMMLYGHQWCLTCAAAASAAFCIIVGELAEQLAVLTAADAALASRLETAAAQLTASLEEQQEAVQQQSACSDTIAASLAEQQAKCSHLGVQLQELLQSNEQAAAAAEQLTAARLGVLGAAVDVVREQQQGYTQQLAQLNSQLQQSQGAPTTALEAGLAAASAAAAAALAAAQAGLQGQLQHHREAAAAAAESVQIQLAAFEATADSLKQQQEAAAQDLASIQGQLREDRAAASTSAAVVEEHVATAIASAAVQQHEAVLALQVQLQQHEDAVAALKAEQQTEQSNSGAAIADLQQQLSVMREELQAADQHLMEQLQHRTGEVQLPASCSTVSMSNSDSTGHPQLMKPSADAMLLRHFIQLSSQPKQQHMLLRGGLCLQAILRSRLSQGQSTQPSWKQQLRLYRAAWLSSSSCLPQQMSRQSTYKASWMAHELRCSSWQAMLHNRRTSSSRAWTTCMQMSSSGCSSSCSNLQRRQS
jgi:hypothetical protein